MSLFTQYPLSADLLESLDRIGFKETTEIQEKAIPALLEGKDLIACSSTGSGKTGAFLIPLIHQLTNDENKQALVLVPTRELANQVFTFASDLIKNSKNIQAVELVGGSDIRRQFKRLQKNPRLIVATPGRLIDHLKRNTVQLKKVGNLILDEGDRMIDMGFLPQLKQILNYMPEKKQTAFFTATMDDEVKKLAKKHLHDPEQIIIGNISKPVATVSQKAIKIKVKDKEERLLEEINQRKGSVIVFLKTQRRTTSTCKYLKEFGIQVGEIHGGRSQGQRNRAIKNFTQGQCRVLCATDVASRGIDVPHIAHVINLDMPANYDDYIHRVGRTARNGGEGQALSFVSPQEVYTWNLLAKKIEQENLILEDSEVKVGYRLRNSNKSKKKKAGGPPRRNNKKRNFKERRRTN